MLVCTCHEYDIVHDLMFMSYMIYMISSIATQKRATLRLLTELYLVCLYPDGMSIANILIDLMSRDRGNDPTHTTLSLVVSFLRYGGEEFVGVSSRKQNEV